MGSSTKGVPFIPMPDPFFVRDPNMLHLLQGMRGNIMAAFGKSGSGGFLPRSEVAVTASDSPKAESPEEAASPVLWTIQSAYDVSAGVGAAGTHYLSSVLPVGTVLVRAFCVVVTGFSGDPGVTLSIRGGDGADEFDVFPDSGLASAWSEGYHSSISIGQSAGESARAFKVVVTGGDISVGKLRFYAEIARCEA